MSTDWSRYRKCPVCHAEIGAACVDLSGVWSERRLLAAREVPAKQPHTRRRLRTVAS